MKVLLVEDTPLNMEIAKFMLEDEGIEVMTAENGQIAVNIFNNSPENTFNAVLMDVTLPRTDAVTVPIIAMTADAYSEDIRRTTDAGMNAHLTKPVSQEKMLSTLEKFYSV